jgi:chemotaxis protein MotB
VSPNAPVPGHTPARRSSLNPYTTMKEANNPFTAPPPGSRRGAGSAIGWTLAVLMATAAAGALMLWRSAADRIQVLEPLRAHLDNATTRLTEALGQIELGKEQTGELQVKLTNLTREKEEQVREWQAKAAHLAKEKEAVGQAAKQLEDQMRQDLESRDVTISKLQGKLTVNILDRVMFDSGEAVLKPDGETVLRKIADILEQHRALKIHVIGHTDNVPIRNRYPSNWELSAARALAAVHFLTEKAGVAPARVGAVGYGEFRPIADNSTAEGRAKNRRIAVTILPDELIDPEPFTMARADPAKESESKPALTSPLTPKPEAGGTNSAGLLPE